MPGMTIAPEEEVQVIPSIFDRLKLNRYQPNMRTLNEVKAEEKISSAGNPYTRVSFWFESNIFDPKTGELEYDNRGYKMKTRVYGSVMLNRKNKLYDKFFAYYKSLEGYINLFCSIEGIEENFKSTKIRDDGTVSYSINADSITAISRFHLEEEVMQRLREATSDTADTMTDPAPLTASSSSTSYDDDQPF